MGADGHQAKPGEWLRGSFKCAFGFHDWRVLSASPWGYSTWHKWKVRRECRRCGDYQDYMETNERRLPEVDHDD